MKRTNGAIRGIAVTAVVLIMVTVVLSTATYAWYRVVNRAVGNSVTFQAINNDTGGGDLTITWDLDTLNNYIIDFNNPTNDLYPMIPISEAKIDETTYAEFTTHNFNTTFQTVNAMGEYIARLAGVQIDPFILNGNVGNDTQNYFYLVNTNVQYDMDVDVIYMYSGVLSDKLRIAFFTGDDPDNMTLKGIMSMSEDIYYGAIQKNAPLTETPTMPDAYVRTKEMRLRIAPEGHCCVAMVAWLDGVKMQDENSRQTTSFIVKFDGILDD